MDFGKYKKHKLPAVPGWYLVGMLERGHGRNELRRDMLAELKKRNPDCGSFELFPDSNGHLRLYDIGKEGD